MNKRLPWYARWYILVGIILLAVISILLVRVFWFEPFRAPSQSMSPSVPMGSHFLVEKAGFGNYRAYGVTVLRTEVTAILQRGDLIVFEYPRNPSVEYLKRVIGLPGDKVEYRAKQLFINGELVTGQKQSEDGQFTFWEEALGDAVYQIANNKAALAKDFQFSVPPDNFFVLGDNRDHSQDSRHWGFVPKQNLIGRVVKVFSTEKDDD